MAKPIKAKKHKVAPKKIVTTDNKIVIVGNYKTGQLAWIKKNGVYNWPVREEDGGARTPAAPSGEDFPAALAKTKELWLYANAKSERHVFSASFVGKMTAAEFRAAYPTYAKLGASKQKAYYVFKAKPVDYPSKLGNQVVLARTADFGKRCVKVKKAVEQFKKDGEFAPLAAYLPKELAHVPRPQLRVCEAAVQMDFFAIMGDCVCKAVPFPALEKPKFTFVDLFAGIGGFHLAMHELGGKCVFASEWDRDAQITYAANYGIVPKGDITKINEIDIPKHDVLCAGFPCQAFSKAGKQLGFADETKGTLFFDVERILKYHKSKYIILENVRNLVSHDNGNTWKTIHSHLMRLGYRLTPEPLIISPHYLGVPQLRERVVVLGVYDPKNSQRPLEVSLPPPKLKSACSLDSILEVGCKDADYALTEDEVEVIDTWDEFYRGIKEKVLGFPIWVDWFKTPPPPQGEMPEWKRLFIEKNNRLYRNNKEFIDRWLAKHNNLESFTPTMRKMEWQCGESVASAWDAFLQMRPSGLRIKRPDCAPALVAIVQVPIIGKYRRRMTLREAARLQSFDDRFIPNANMHQAYKQFGNAVNVKVIKYCAQKLFEACA